MLEMFTDPDSYFERKAKFGGWKVPAFIVLVASLSVTMKVVAAWYAAGDGPSYTQTAFTSNMAGEAIITYLSWIVLGLVGFAVASALGGRPSLGRTIKVYGYGYVAVAVAGVIRAVGWYVGLTDATFPEKQGPMSVPPGEQFDMYTEFMAQGASDTAVTVAVIAAGVIAFGATYFWWHGLQHTSELDSRDSLIAAAVSGLVIAVYLFNDVLGLF